MEKRDWRKALREIIKKSYFILGRTGKSGVVNMLEDFISQELDKAREEEREKISGHLLKVKSYGEEYSKDSNCDCNYLNGWNDCLKEIKKYLN